MRRLIIDIHPSVEKLSRFDIIINGETADVYEEGLTAYGVQEVVKAEISKAIESLD